METAYLVFSDDFGEHPSSCQHLFRYLPDGAAALWTNTVGMRHPRLTVRDLKKSILKSGKMLQGLFSDSVISSAQVERLYVCQPPMLPFLNIPGIQALNKFSVCRTVQKKLANLGLHSPVLVITAPNASDYIGEFGERRTVYYCVDDFEEWPGLNKKRVQKMEEEIVRKADVLIATSQNLVEKLEKSGKHVHLLTHGVDYEFFQALPDQEHYLLNEIPKPRVGYFGLFDKRSNHRLIEELAARMPDISWVITGNIESDVSSLRNYNNIYFTGSVPYHELPAMAGGWDICMLPYMVNPLTDAIQPLKIKEYLATGKPVISTPIREALRLRAQVTIAETVDDWIKSIRLLVEGISEEALAARTLFLQKESWSQKAEQFFSLCMDH